MSAGWSMDANGQKDADARGFQPSFRIAVALALLAALAYLPGAGHSFVYDDHGAIVENEFLSSPSNLLRVLTFSTLRDPAVLDGQRPVLLFTMFLDRAGSHAPIPWRHHATNLALHALAVLLLFQLARKLSGGSRAGDGVAAAAAIILAIHPAWSEAVQLPSYREDLLGLVFVLGYLLTDFIRRDAIRWPAQLAALALALGSKETAWAAPLLLGWMRLCVPVKKGRAVEVAVGFLIVLAYVGAGYAGRPVQAVGGIWNGISLHWPENLWTAPWIFWRYVALALIPFPLVADRLVEAIPVPWDPRFAGCAVASLTAAWWIWRARRREALLAFGAGWTLLAFGPVSNLVPLFNPMADRYLYGLSPGFALFFACAIIKFRKRWLLPLLCVVWIVMLQLRLGDWHDDATLWSVTARQEPRSARAQVWMGLNAKQQGDRVAARAAFERARSVNPQEVSALVNLAVLDGEAGDFPAAERVLREALRLRPETREARANLALALELQGKREEALQLVAGDKKTGAAEAAPVK